MAQSRFPHLEVDENEQPRPRDDELWDMVFGIDFAIAQMRDLGLLHKDVRFRVIDARGIGCANIEDGLEFVRVNFSRDHLLRIKDTVGTLLWQKHAGKFLRFEDIPDRGSIQNPGDAAAAAKWAFAQILYTRRFSMASAMYVTFHELAHVIDGHLAYLAKRKREGLEVTSISRQALEYDADHFALSTLFVHVLESLRAQDEMFGFRYLDDEHAMRCAGFVCYSAARMSGFPFDLSGDLRNARHPPGLLRALLVFGMVAGHIQMFAEKGIAQMDGENLMRECADSVESLLMGEAPETPRVVVRENSDAVWSDHRRHVHALQAEWHRLYDELDAMKSNRYGLSLPRTWWHG